jgi:hypothetical protein
MKNYSKLLTLVVLVAMMGACAPSVQRDSDAIRRAMASFTYVGESGGYRTALGPGPVGPDPHGIQIQDFPKLLEEGHEYVFHRRKTGEAPWIVLERDLRASGATIIWAPKGNLGLALRYVGSPLFVINFRKGHYRGTIRNFDMSPEELAKISKDSNLVGEDFVLTIDSIDYY